MTPNVLFYLTFAGLIIVAATSISAKVLREFSRSELQDYCRRRRRRALFSQILDRHDHIALAAESLQAIGTALMILAGNSWLLASDRSAGQLQWAELFSGVGIGAILLLALTIWIPAAVVRLWAAPFLYHTWRVLRVVDRLLTPLTIGAAIVDALLRRLAGRNEELADEEEAFEDEIRTIVTAGEHDGLLEAGAREMIEGVMELGDADVADIMTPRREVDAIDVGMAWPDVLRFIAEVGRTRIPVYEKNLDHVVGILFVKDLLPELSKPASESRKSLREFLRPAWSVPKTKAVDDMLQQFLQTRSHLAIVRDEYDTFAGVVTIEDVLEEIVGEIVDELDEEAEQDITLIDDTTAEVLGNTHLDELNDRLGLDLVESDEFDTIAGLVVETLGRIPKVDETLDIDNLRITVLQASRRHVQRLRLEILSHAD